MTKPARYLDPFGDPVEAVRWTPDDPLAIGTCIGWLMSSGADFHHPDGAGGTTTLAVRGVNGRPDVTAQPGDWVVGKRPPLGRLRFAVVADDVFGKMFTADEAAYRGAVPSEAGRATPARRDFSKGWKPGPLPEDLAALAPDDPLVERLSLRIGPGWIFKQTIGGVVAALRELRPDGVYDPDDETLLDTAARRVGYSGPGTTRLSIVRHVIDALNAETAEVTR